LDTPSYMQYENLYTHGNIHKSLLTYKKDSSQIVDTVRRITPSQIRQRLEDRS